MTPNMISLVEQLEEYASTNPVESMLPKPLIKNVSSKSFTTTWPLRNQSNIPLGVFNQLGWRSRSTTTEFNALKKFAKLTRSMILSCLSEVKHFFVTQKCRATNWRELTINCIWERSSWIYKYVYFCLGDRKYQISIAPKLETELVVGLHFIAYRSVFSDPLNWSQ